MKTIGTKIIVKESGAQETKTKAGLYVPTNAEKKYKTGEVVEVGEGDKDTEMKVSKGDKILFSSFGGTEVHVEGEKYLVIDQKDIFVIL